MRKESKREMRFQSPRWLVETRANRSDVDDLEAVAKIARAHNAISVSDNTFATPWIQRRSNSIRYGHSFRDEFFKWTISDMVGGVIVVGENKELGDQIGISPKFGRCDSRPVR